MPDHADQELFIQEASVWSSLNHPHVARLLGACHVGSRPFIAHESVRTLVEYASEVKDRQQMWRRVYEVALGLQYLHERGLSCRELSLGSVFCAQYDSRTVLLGAGLVKIGVTDASQSEEHAAWRARTIASDARALSWIALDALHVFDQRCDNTDSVAEGGTRNHRAMPAERPHFVAEAEWEVTFQLGRVDFLESSAVRAVDWLRTSAGIAEDNWVGDSVVEESDLDAPNALIEIGRLRVPELGMSIADILSSCEEAAAASCGVLSRVHSRLADVFVQLREMSQQTASHTPPTKAAIADFVSVLVRFYRSVKRLNREGRSISDGWGSSNSSGSASSLLEMIQELDERELVRFHFDVYRMLKLHALDASRPVHEWEPEYYNGLLSRDGDSLSGARLGLRPRLEVSGADESDEAEALEAFERARWPRPGQRFPHLAEPTMSRATKLPRWFLPPYEVRISEEFGSGAFGSVHHGAWFGTLVVVKRLFIGAYNLSEVRAQFHREADVWFKLDHINVIKLYGACDIDEPFFVCEYASGGDLNAYLDRQGRSPCLAWSSLLNAALGVQYLHANGVAHADLKGNNILVGSDDIAKLSDFGSAFTLSTRGDSDAGALGAYRWKAPECLRGEAPTFVSDVYSFAMCMIEVLTGNLPWGRLDDVVMRVLVKRGDLPLQPSQIADPEWRLIQRMCCTDPSERLPINAVVMHLTSLVERQHLSQLIPPTPEAVSMNQFFTRDGALMSVLPLVHSGNTRLATYASDHLLFVCMNRGSRSGRREIEAIVALLASGSEAHQLGAVTALAALSGVCQGNSVLISASGGIPLIVGLVRDGTDAQKEMAAQALRNLAFNKDSVMLAASADGIGPLVALVRDGTDGQKVVAAGALANLSYKSEEMKVSIASAGAIDTLMALVRDGSDLQKEKAAQVLLNLALVDNNVAAMTSRGGIAPLVALMRDGNDVQKEKAAGALANLACKNADAKMVIAVVGGIPPLVALVRDGSDAQKANAAAALRNLAVNKDNKALIVAAGAVDPLVELAENGTPEQQENAGGVLWNLAY